MKNLESKMGAKHREALEKTPFSIYKEIPSLPMSLSRLPAIIRRFRERNISFAFARGVEVPFTPSEFSIVLGLPTKGQPVDVNLKMKSRTMERLFSGKLQNLNRKNIVNKLDELANKDSAKDIDDFCRLYMLLVFNYFLFPTSNYWTPGFLLPYLDDLSNVGEFAWGITAYSFLVQEMRKCVGAGGNRKKYLDGCTVGLMVSEFDLNDYITYICIWLRITIYL